MRDSEGFCSGSLARIGNRAAGSSPGPGQTAASEMPEDVICPAGTRPEERC